MKHMDGALKTVFFGVVCTFRKPKQVRAKQLLLHGVMIDAAHAETDVSDTTAASVFMYSEKH